MNLTSYKQIMNHTHWEFDDRIFSDDLNQRVIIRNEQEDGLPAKHYCLLALQVKARNKARCL